jgi:hypothetical protein
MIEIFKSFDAAAKAKKHLFTTLYNGTVTLSGEAINLMMRQQYDGLCLHELVAEGSWGNVMKRLKSHPQEGLHVVDSLEWLGSKIASPGFAVLADDSNISALELLCVQQNPPRRVLRAYLDAQPKAIKIVTSDNKSPLFLACVAKQRPEILSILAHADPDAILIQDLHGQNPFHVCCENGAPIRILMEAPGLQRTERALLACDQRRNHAPIHFACRRKSRISLDDFGLVFGHTRVESLAINPLQVLCQEFQTNFERCLRTSPIPTTEVSTGDPSPYCSPDRSLKIERFWMWRPMDALLLRRAWNMAFILLGAHRRDMTTFPLLHECLERDSDCSSDMFDYILCLNPHYACQMSEGLLPLHVVCRLATQQSEEQKWVERIRVLVQLYPKATAIPDPDDNLPLEILAGPTVTYRHVGPIFERNVCALARFDLPETLYPYVLSQLVRRKCVNGIFQVLKDTPTLASIH